MFDFRLNVRGDMKEILRDLGHVNRTLVKRSAASAMNRTMTQARTQVVREVAAEVGVKQAPIRKRVAFGRRDRATAGRLTAALRGRLQKLSVTSVMTPKQRGDLGKFVGRGNRKTGTYAAGRLWPGAFIAPTRNRKTLRVFKRKGRERYEVELIGLEVSSPINRSARKHVQNLGPKLFRTNFERDLAWRLRGRG